MRKKEQSVDVALLTFFGSNQIPAGAITPNALAPLGNEITLSNAVCKKGENGFSYTISRRGGYFSRDKKVIKVERPSFAVVIDEKGEYFFASYITYSAIVDSLTEAPDRTLNITLAQEQNQAQFHRRIQCLHIALSPR